MAKTKAIEQNCVGLTEAEKVELAEKRTHQDQLEMGCLNMTSGACAFVCEHLLLSSVIQGILALFRHLKALACLTGAW